MNGGVRQLTGAQLAEQDQLEADFDRVEFHVGATEIRLSKGDAARYSVNGGVKMRAFLACLERWAKRMHDDGYEILSVPEEGPGTMVWKAAKR